MICPICGSETEVVCSRTTDETVFRRRKCLQCNYAIYTEETEITHNAWKRAQNDYETKLKQSKKELKKCKS